MTAPVRKAPNAQIQGMRKAGTRNMENPVAMPIGGITIFFKDTGPRASRMRQVSTAARPINEPKVAPVEGKCINIEGCKPHFTFYCCAFSGGRRNRRARPAAAGDGYGLSDRRPRAADGDLGAGAKKVPVKIEVRSGTTRR